MQSFPEIARAGWFTVPFAKEKIVGRQRVFSTGCLDELDREVHTTTPHLKCLVIGADGCG
jgi:predicted NUDIX family NTP pyrophosphohydrolase